ncbi:hypothetical protein AC578_9951 [Pseudocercospora eumusae]|uniref:DUF6570 domain-containing protein n=1 Tax=Pseudocercospora eumusae TaxID=321146 RepID=A0A139H092_9PEZI|nr:hypothetical protein AC578_9951 [Pseudocercospora eumusae]
MWSPENNIDPSPDHAFYGLTELTMIEEMRIARIHGFVPLYQVRGQQYGYKGHVVRFPRDLAKLFTQLPYKPEDINFIVLVPDNNNDSPINRQVRRSVIKQWLEFKKANDPYYTDIIIDHEAIDNWPEENDIMDRFAVGGQPNHPDAN